MKLTKADRQYLGWLHRHKLQVPYSEEWGRLIQTLMHRYDYSAQIASRQVGLDENGTTIGKLAKKTSGQIDVCTLSKIAAHLGMEQEVEERLEEILGMSGKDGWGPNGERHCGGCGTWFHDHHQDGHCEDCWTVSVVGGETRDVRFAKGRIRRINRDKYEPV